MLLAMCSLESQISACIIVPCYLIPCRIRTLLTFLHLCLCTFAFFQSFSLFFYSFTDICSIQSTASSKDLMKWLFFSHSHIGKSLNSPFFFFLNHSAFIPIAFIYVPFITCEQTLKLLKRRHASLLPSTNSFAKQILLMLLKSGKMCHVGWWWQFTAS